MFTGLIEKKGRVVSNTTSSTGSRLVIDATWPVLQTGESIAVNGVCLTLLKPEQPLVFDLSLETLQCTSLGELKPGEDVNLERAMNAADRFGGHYVTGHVDTTAQLVKIKPVGDYLEMTVSDFVAPNAALYLIPKGSITLDGVSLTINEFIQGGLEGCQSPSITLMLIPHTLQLTTFGQLPTDHRFNVEFDYIARVVAHQLSLFEQMKKDVCL